MHDLMTKMQEKKGVQNWYFGIVRTMPYGYDTTTNYSLQKNTSHHNLIFELTSIKLYFRILCTMLSTSRPTKVKLSLNMSKEKTTKKYTWGSSSIQYCTVQHYNIPILDILFSSNHNIHKSSCGLCFWTSDPLIDRFY